MFTRQGSTVQSFTNSSNCELAIDTVTSIDNYETGRKRTRKKGYIKTEKSEKKTHKLLSKNYAARTERMTKPPSSKWLEDHRRQCYPPSPVRTKIRENATPNLKNSNPKAKGNYRIVTVDDRSYEYYSPS
jgi:hypothetical protein